MPADTAVVTLAIGLQAASNIQIPAATARMILVLLLQLMANGVLF